jgi:hypothetical protein
MIQYLKTILFLLVISHSIQEVRTYDTGHHADLTRNGLDVLGYGENAQDVAVVMNWLVDYYSYTLETESIVEMNSMHHDNLQDLQMCSNYLTTLVHNTRGAIIAAANDSDVLTYLSIVGATLHAYQDFYTHSNWVELHQSQCGCHRDDTWFSTLFDVNGNVTELIPTLASLSTYSWGEECDPYQRDCLPGLKAHGDYCSGVNKDSYMRPMFEASYAFAFAGTVEWIYNIERWANESPNGTTVVNNARNYQPATGEDYDDLKKIVAYSIEISYATKTVFQDDGHYKGAGSGDFSRFFTSALKFIASSSVYKNQYKEKKFYLSLVNPNLYDIHGSTEYSDAVEVFVPYSQLPSELRSYRKIKVRTWLVNIPDKKLNTPSPYATVTIGNQTLEENVMDDVTYFKPHWTSISFVPSNIDAVNIQYTLWNDRFPGHDEQIPIVNDNDGSMNTMYDIVTGTLSGDVTGRYDSRYNLLQLQSGSNYVSLYIITQQFGNCSVSGFPNMFCDDEAYSQLYLSNFCGVDKGADSDANTLQISISLIFVLSLILLFINTIHL